MSMAGEVASREHVTKMFPLNSRRLTAETLTRIAAVTTGASASEARQLIEGKLSAHEPRNVQDFGNLMEAQPITWWNLLASKLEWCKFYSCIT